VPNKSAAKEVRTARVVLRHLEWQPGQTETAAEGGAGQRSVKNAAATKQQTREALHSPRPLLSPKGPALLQVVADYKRVSAVQLADHASHGRASGPQYPGVRVGRSRPNPSPLWEDQHVSEQECPTITMPA
jgi:hypothetical protein